MWMLFLWALNCTDRVQGILAEDDTTTLSDSRGKFFSHSLNTYLLNFHKRRNRLVGILYTYSVNVFFLII